MAKMSNPATSGIFLTKEYYKTNLKATDFQWVVSGVADDFTLLDLFALVERAETLVPGVSSVLGVKEFASFMKQIREPVNADKHTQNIEYLQLYWSTDYDTRITTKTDKDTDQKGGHNDRLGNRNYWDDPNNGEISNLMAFDGVGPGCPSASFPGHECSNSCPKEIGYAIEFTPVNYLAHLPIRLKTNVLFYPPFVEKDRVFTPSDFCLEIKPTLWCFITSVFWELTFAGTFPITDKE